MENQNNNSEELKWSVMGLWNKMLGLTQRYPPKERDYISFSDLGKEPWSRYQKMMGVKVTNPFPERVLRKFAAGNEFHNLMSNVFKALGILVNTQDEPDESGRNQWSIIQPEGKLLKLLGKYDNLVGGKVDRGQVMTQCHKMGFSDFVKERTLLMADFLEENYPEGLPELLYEIKSINSMAFWAKKDYLRQAYPQHELQCYGYLKANNLPEGRILYLSKDDLMMAELPIYLKDPEMTKRFNEDREMMSNCILNREEPPKPENIIFDPRKKLRFQWKKEKHILEGCYDYNWQVKRSQYFTLMTGFKEESRWKAEHTKELSKKNVELKEEYKKGQSEK